MIRSIAGLCISLFSCGWYGAERIFFLNHFKRRRVSLRHLLGLVYPFFGRFFATALLIDLIIMGPVLLFCTFGLTPTKHPTSFHVEMTCAWLAMDFALTFVPSALSFTARSASHALGIGFRMIRQTWPRSAWYVLCQPLALNMVNLTNPAQHLSVQLVSLRVGVVVALLTKGATAAFYLRERPCQGEDGAAHGDPAASAAPTV